MAVQFLKAPIAFKGSNDTEEKNITAKLEDVGEKIDQGVDKFTGGVESVGKGIDKATDSVVKAGGSILAAKALLGEKFKGVIDWFYNTTKNAETGEVIRNSLNKKKTFGALGVAAAVAATIAIVKGVKSHIAKKAEAKAQQEAAAKEAEASKTEGKNLDITSSVDDEE